jgi:hypothetical protein
VVASPRCRSLPGLVPVDQAWGRELDLVAVDREAGAARGELRTQSDPEPYTRRARSHRRRGGRRAGSGGRSPVLPPSWTTVASRREDRRSQAPTRATPSTTKAAPAVRQRLTQRSTRSRPRPGRTIRYRPRRRTWTNRRRGTKHWPAVRSPRLAARTAASTSTTASPGGTTGRRRHHAGHAPTGAVRSARPARAQAVAASPPPHRHRPETVPQGPPSTSGGGGPGTSGRGRSHAPTATTASSVTHAAVAIRSSRAVGRRRAGRATQLGPPRRLRPAGGRGSGRGPASPRG